MRRLLPAQCRVVHGVTAPVLPQRQPGPPQMARDSEADGAPTIRKSMENEHTAGNDATKVFTAANGCTSTAMTEWKFCYCPETLNNEFPERPGLSSHQHRKPIPPSTYLANGGPLETCCNSKLRAGGHSEVIMEELLAGRLYTGPMYMKYNVREICAIRTPV